MIKFARLIKLFAAGALALGLGGGSLAQEPDTVPAIVALEFKSHDEGMKNIRFHNPDQGLNLEGMTELPFQWVDNGAEPLRMSDLSGGAEALAELVETQGIAYDGERLDGFCDTAIMRKYNSSDLLCKPSRPPPAMVFLALFHPRTSEPLAITSYIDNSFGGAVNLRPVRPALAPAPEREEIIACNPGQWVKPDDPSFSESNLAVLNPLGNALYYQCRLGEDGALYWQAHPISAPGRSQPRQRQPRQGDNAADDAADDADDDAADDADKNLGEWKEVDVGERKCKSIVSSCDGGDIGY